MYWNDVSSRLGIGNINPQYTLDISGSLGSQSLYTQDIYLSGTHINANASEINILDGALISTSELNLLSGRSGTLLDSNNISSHAVTSITAGSGLSSTGTGPGSITLNIGAGNGISLLDNSIDISLASSGITSSRSSPSGLEITSGGLRMIGGCSNNEVLSWDNTSNVWKCSAPHL